jgi:hypothetical protein
MKWPPTPRHADKRKYPATSRIRIWYTVYTFTI